MHAPRLKISLALALALAAFKMQAQGVIWNGPATTFTQAVRADWTQATNQDRLTTDVWLTRATTRGLFNAALEGTYTHYASPAGTAWAFGELANYSTLNYQTWEAWNGGSGNVYSMIGRDAVLHLVNDNIYLAITFTSWGGSGGGFSYTRSTNPAGVPEPAATSLALAGAAIFLARKRR